MTHTLLQKFKDVRIGVIGDAMLDTFLLGDVRRISPEAPIPIVTIQQEHHVPGGAANVAANIASLGGRAHLLSVIGADARGRMLATIIRRHHITWSGMIHPKWTTIQKTRVVGGGQHIVRIDHEKIVPMNMGLERRLMHLIERGMPTWDVVLVSDYAKGMITPRIAKKIITLARLQGKRIIVDTKPVNAPYFKGAFLFTPNSDEALMMAGVGNISKAGRLLQGRLRANILITQGGDGMTLFQGKRQVPIASRSRPVFDVVGAGDTVVAVCALALGAGEDLETAARVANHAASVVVGKPGTATLTPRELLEVLF